MLLKSSFVNGQKSQVPLLLIPLSPLSTPTRHPHCVPRLSLSLSLSLSLNMSPVRAINGQRPPQLRIKKDSHVIAKKANHTAEHGQNHHPIIIYAHSPKIIHAKPRDFMAIVQKLTGLSPRPQNLESSSNLTEGSKPARVSNSGETSSSSPKFDAAPNQFLADMPLFTPNSANFFLSPLLRYADAVSVSPNLGNLMISPSPFEAKKELPQY